MAIQTDMRGIAIRLELLERRVKMLHQELDRQHEVNKRLRREIKATRSSVDSVAKTTDQNHRVLAQIVRRSDGLPAR